MLEILDCLLIVPNTKKNDLMCNYYLSLKGGGTKMYLPIELLLCYYC